METPILLSIVVLLMVLGAEVSWYGGFI